MIDFCDGFFLARFKARFSIIVLCAFVLSLCFFLS